MHDIPLPRRTDHCSFITLQAPDAYRTKPNHGSKKPLASHFCEFFRGKKLWSKEIRGYTLED